MTKKIEAELRSVRAKIKFLEQRMTDTVSTIKRNTQDEDSHLFRYELVTFLPGNLKELAEDMEKMKNLRETQQMLEYLLKDDEENAE